MKDWQVSKGLEIAQALDDVTEYLKDVPGKALQKARDRITEQAADLRELVCPEMPKRSA